MNAPDHVHVFQVVRGTPGMHTSLSLCSVPAACPSLSDTSSFYTQTPLPTCTFRGGHDSPIARTLSSCSPGQDATARHVPPCPTSHTPQRQIPGTWVLTASTPACSLPQPQIVRCAWDSRNGAHTQESPLTQNRICRGRLICCANDD